MYALYWEKNTFIQLLHTHRTIYVNNQVQSEYKYFVFTELQYNDDGITYYQMSE